MYKSNYVTHPLISAPANARLLVAGFKKWYFEHMKRVKPMFEQLCEIENSERLSDSYASMIGTGLAVEATDGGPTEYEDLLNGPAKDIRNYEYRKGYRITQAQLEDDVPGISKRPMKSLPRSIEMKIESLTGALVSGCLTTTYALDPNSSTVALASASHNYPTGKTDLTNTTNPTTWSNVLAVAAAPSPSSMESMNTLAISQTDWEGYPIDNGEGWFYLVPKDLYATIWAVTNSTNRSGEISNTKEIVGAQGPWNRPIKMFRWLTSTTAWGMLNKSNLPFVHQWRIKPAIKEDFDFNNWVLRVAVRARFGQAAMMPWGILWTAGA